MAEEHRKIWISILVPSHRNCLESLPIISRLAALRNDAVEIVVADNSGDPVKRDALRVLSNSARNLKVLENPKDLRASANYLSALNSASGDYVMICGDDDYLEPGFIADALTLLAKQDGPVCIVPNIYQYLGEGKLSPVPRQAVPATDWAGRVVGHIAARIIPVLTYSVVPKPLLAAFLAYQKIHPLIATFQDWNFEYFARAWCRIAYVENGYYLYDYRRWMEGNTAIESDAKLYAEAGLPGWFVALHRWFWAVDIGHFVDSGYFPADPEQRASAIAALTAHNMAAFRNEWRTGKHSLLENAPVSADLQQEIRALAEQTSWSHPAIAQSFQRVLEAIAPAKALAYAAFVAEIKAMAGFHPATVTTAPAPLVSVVIPCYNQSHFLREAVASVIGQTHADWECLIVDDGSPDDTAAVARELIAAHPGHRIALIEKPNGGLADARNTGIRAARGRYILPLDADDILHPRMIEATLAVLEADPGIDIAYTDVQEFGASSHYIRTLEDNPANIPIANHHAYCSLYRRELWSDVGGYNTNMVQGYEDWDFWIGLAERGHRARRIPEALLYYRVKDSSMFTQAQRHNAALRARMVMNHPAMYDPSMVAQAEAILAELDRSGVGPANQGSTEEVLALIADAERLTATQGPASAVVHYRRWLWFRSATAPLAHAVYFNLGAALEQLGDKEGAAQAYRQALEKQPGFEPARNNLALLQQFSS